MSKAIELTLEQILDLDEERAKLGAMEDDKVPGMMIAQVFGDHMRVDVIDNEKALAVQKVMDTKHVGKTSRTAYDLPVNCNVTGAEPVGGASGGRSC